jgi:hypothetical protein
VYSWMSRSFCNFRPSSDGNVQLAPTEARKTGFEPATSPWQGGAIRLSSELSSLDVRVPPHSSTQSIGYVCVVERSTIERNMKGVTIWWAELGKSILRQREILLEDDVRPSWFVNDYGKQSSEKDFGFRIELRWHQLDRRHRFRERHAVDRGAMQRHHLTKVAFMKGVYGM